MFEGIAKTNTTNTYYFSKSGALVFEGIAKTNTTNTYDKLKKLVELFEGIAKTNTTNTAEYSPSRTGSLRVLLKQIQHTNSDQSIDRVHKF